MAPFSLAFQPSSRLSEKIFSTIIILVVYYYYNAIPHCIEKLYPLKPNSYVFFCIGLDIAVTF